MSFHLTAALNYCTFIGIWVSVCSHSYQFVPKHFIHDFSVRKRLAFVLTSRSRCGFHYISTVVLSGVLRARIATHPYHRSTASEACEGLLTVYPSLIMPCSNVTDSTRFHSDSCRCGFTFAVPSPIPLNDNTDQPFGPRR